MPEKDLEYASRYNPFSIVIGLIDNTTIFQIIRAIRPKQWIKNTVVFAALIFSQRLFDAYSLITSFFAFSLFCLLTGSVYLINDIMDTEDDRRHPYKKRRPIASGKLKISTAVTTAVIMAIFSLGMSLYLDLRFGIITLVYFVLNIAYSKYLKHVVIIDVMIISLGFVLRAIGGAVVIDVEISPWLIICTTLLALFLGFGKRRHELVLLKENANEHRPILDEYSPYFLDQIIAVLTASIVVTYAFYTMSDKVQAKLQTTHLNLTIPFVLYGIFRYLYLIHQKNRGGNPTSLLFTDKPLLINILLWMITACAILYF
jgi:4-hydroxybenzoate polyprenyltransferase